MTTSTVVACRQCSTRNRVPAAASGTPRCGKCRAPLPWVADATDSDFTEIVDHSAKPVLVDMWAPWCGPCRTVSPALNQLAAEHAGEVKLVKVDVDQSPQLARRFSVQAVPTLLVLRGGEVIARQSGAAPLPALRTWLDQALGPARDTAARSRG